MAIFSLHATTGSRTRGQSAGAKVDYLSRGGPYRRHGDIVLHVESGHMPVWTENGRSPRMKRCAAAYWHAADQYERANGRLFKHLQLALPIELTLPEQIDLVRSFVTWCTTTGIDGGRLPYTWTIHAGSGNNPHADLMISERINDGFARSPSTWFKQAPFRRHGLPAPDPWQGGARKTAALKPKAWLLSARRAWADAVNAVLEQAGAVPRVDHRSHAARNISEVPTIHVGHRAMARLRQGDHSLRAALNLTIALANRRRRRAQQVLDARQQEEAELLQALWRLQQQMALCQFPAIEENEMDDHLDGALPSETDRAGGHRPKPLAPR